MRWWLVVFLLAGCTSEGGGARADDLYINIAGPEWTIRLPVPDDALFGPGTWRDTLRVSTGNASLHWDGGALPLTVHGTGSVRLEALPRVDAPHCCLMDHREALWSSGPAAQGLRLEVTDGPVSQVHIDHGVVACRSGCGEEDVPRVCTQRVQAQAVDLEAGPHRLEARIGRTC